MYMSMSFPTTLVYISQLLRTHAFSRPQANSHQSSLTHQTSLDTEAAAIADDLYINDSIDELSDSQSQCSTVSQDQEKTSTFKESRKEGRDRPPTAKKRKYKHK